MNLEAIRAVLVRDVEELAAIIHELEPGYTVSKIEAQILKSKIKNLSIEVTALFENLAASNVGVVIQTSTELQNPVSSSEITPHTANSKNEKLGSHSKKPSSKEIQEASQPIAPKSHKIEMTSNIAPTAVAASKANEADNVQRSENVVSRPNIMEVEETKKPTDTATRVTLADKFTETNLSLNDRIGQSKALIDRASLLGRKPVTDIHKAIKINDRVGFIRELFNGDAAKYQQTIDTLNHLSDLDEALRYIHENFSWDQETEVFKNFIEVIYRRFMQ